MGSRLASLVGVAGVSTHGPVPRHGRFWEVDLGRGLAVLLMVVFHYSFTLRYFGVFELGDGWWYWVLFPRLIGSSFIVLSGISLAISSGRGTTQEFWARNAVRALRILAFGLLITVVTSVILPEGTIVFGILHLLGTSILLALPFVQWPRLALAAGVALFSGGLYLSGLAVDVPWLLWLGLPPRNFYSLDYYPLLPWFGLFLMAVYAGKRLYPQGKRAFELGETTGPVRAVGLLGRHSLLIYAVHQPLLVALLYLVGRPILGEVRLPGG